MGCMILLFLLAAPAAEPTPAERSIAAAERALERAPSLYQRHNDLALAYVRRARETADPAYYEKAHAALDRSFELEPDNYGAERLRIRVLLGQREYPQALEKAKALNKRAPDDVLVYGFLADAQVALGDYDEASEAVQWMLDLRPGNAPAFQRGAALRELYGYVDGAAEFLQMAYDRTLAHESEDRARILVDIARLQRFRGDPSEAEATLRQALQVFPGYYYAFAELGRTLSAQGELEPAVEAFRKLYAAAPHPENLFALGKALDAAGLETEARQAFELFEKQAQAKTESWDNANRELIYYWSDFAGKADQAVQLAEMDIARRQDIYTRAAYAWALHKAGRGEEAARQMELAFATGTKDPDLLKRKEALEGGSGK